MRVGRVTIAVAEGWVQRNPQGEGATRGAFHFLSPRVTGTLTLDTIVMPDDFGVIDEERLRRMYLRTKSWNPLLVGEAFDEVSWTDGPVAGVARSQVVNFAGEALIAEMRKRDPEAAESIAAHCKDARYVTRSWVTARGRKLANATYKSERYEGAAADIVDCEAMVRSIRFEREALDN